MAAKFLGLDGLVVGGGANWRNPDPGIPLETYSGSAPRDPLTLWKTQPSLRKVVSFAARQVAQLGWHAYQRASDGDRIRLSDSPAERILKGPSKWISGYRLFEHLVIDGLLYDRYCAVLDNGELIRIPPRLLSIKSDVIGRVSSITLSLGRVKVELIDAPLVIGWGWGDVAAGGVSPLQTLSEILDESKASVKWRREQWSDRPKFAGILKHPSTFKSDKARETFTTSWKSWRDERKGTPILEDGLDYVSPPGPDIEHLRDIEGRQLTDVEVTSAYHIPPELVGARPGNFGNMQAFRSMLFGPTLGPLIVELEQSVNRIVPHLDTRQGVYVEANREGAINGSLLEQAQILQTMTGGPIMLRSEARSRMNLEFVEGTDQLIVPMNVVTGGLASPTDTGSQNLGGGDPAPSTGPKGVPEAEPAAAPAAGMDPAQVRQQLDALGIAFRAGVKPEAAAKAVGLEGIEFFEGVRPITVKFEGDDTEPLPVDEGES